MSSPIQQVTVLGATGQVGKVVLPEVLRAGYHVRVLARSPSKLGAIPEGVDLVGGDLPRIAIH